MARSKPTVMTLKLARDLVRKALAHADEAGSKSLAVAVVDAGATLVALERQDGAGRARPDLSIAKATACLELNFPTRVLNNLFTSDPNLHAVLEKTIGRPLLPVAGGVLIRDAAGRVIGAAGISGGSLEEEEDFLIKAIHELGLQSDPAMDNPA